MVVYLHNHIQGYRKYFSKKISQLSEKIKLKGEKSDEYDYKHTNFYILQYFYGFRKTTN